ncbi:MAG: hypothetical protein H6510_15985 [Acidobacteria bacterium]|nr:hypothetical protein [Acidobacteriota bacterium]MCB9399313.1 hypothetical protein [Acidobacteriota bacterium]
MRKRMIKTYFCLSLLVAINQGWGQTIRSLVQEGFQDTSEISLKGDAGLVSLSNGVNIRLTSASAANTGGFYSNQKFPLANWHVYLVFTVTNPGGFNDECGGETGGDGLAFVIQNGTALGEGGGGLGYKGIGSSVAVEMDTWCGRGTNDPSPNHIGILTNGDTVHATLPTANTSKPFLDGTNHVWIDYMNGIMQIRHSQDGSYSKEPLISYAIDVPGIVNSKEA